MNNMANLTLYNIVKNLLREGMSDDVVMDSIDNKYYVRIKYDDGLPTTQGNPKGSRVIQPVALGTSKKGNKVLRAFQVNGNSRRGAPRWKFFRLDKITSWYPMKKKHFVSPPPSSYGVYNQNGDRSMNMVIRNARFDDVSSPLAALRAKGMNASSAPKISSKNMQGPVAASQQRKKNVFTSQPNSKRYGDFAKNVMDTSPKGEDYWSDYDKALAQNGPIRVDNNDKNYDVTDVDYDENNFQRNTNKR